MVFLENIFLDFIYLIFPFLCYMYFLAYENIIDEKNRCCILEVSLFASFYLMLFHGKYREINLPSILANVPLLFAYKERKKVPIVVMSIILVFYYVNFLNLNIYFVIFEYLLYFYLFYLRKNKIKNSNFLITLFSLIKGIVISFIYFYEGMNYKNCYAFFELLLSVIIFYFLAHLVFYFNKKIFNLLNLHTSIKELQKEKQIKDSLFKISHEIKNPIAVCKGYLDMFDVNDPKVARRYVPILKQEIDRTLNLLKDFLDFTKIKIETDIFDINLLILEVFNSLSNLLNNKRSSFVTNVSDEEFFIEGDYNRIKQVIINVVKNSFEACINDPIISLNVSKNNKYYIIEIKDNGIGMDSYTLKKIKEPFYTTKNYGTGLGVSLSKEIIESHKGSMTYNSIKNVGTTVTIKLPLSKKSFN